GRALQLDSGNPDIQFNLGLHRLRQEQWEDAGRALARALELNPDDTEALFLRAYALEQLGRVDEAARLRQEAVGDNPALDLSLGQRHLALDRPWLNLGMPRPFAGAARALHVALHVQRGQGLLARDELAPAQRELTEAILLAPGSYRAHLLLGEVYRRQGLLAEAVSELRAALWSRDTVQVRLRLAELYLERSQLEEAGAQVRAALALDPESAEAHALEQQLPAQRAGVQPEEE
ncbi:MAG: tetratricopeptide repeat protein, partial [Terriglobia bacterium]